MNAADINKAIKTSAYIGSDGLFDTGTLRSYKEQLDGLSIAQTKASLASAGLTKEQQNQILSYIASSNAVKTLTGEQILERLSTEMNSKADAKRLLTKTGLLGATELNTDATVVFTEAKKKEILTSELLNVEEKKLILSLFGEGTAKTGVVAATWELVKANLALIASNPTTWILGGIAVALALAAAYEASRVSVEKAKEKLEETESSLSEVNSKLEENKRRIEEINALETPSITDKEDLERLKEENKELEIRQKYLEKQKQLDQQQLVQSSKDEYNQKYGQEANEKRQKQAIKTWGAGHENANTSGDIVQEQIDEYKQLQDRRKEILVKDKDKITEQESKELEELNKKLGESELALINTRTELQGFRDDLSSTGESSPELESVKSDLEDIDNLLLSPGEKLVEFINSDVVTNDKEKIIELAKTGKLTADVMENQFSNVDKYLKENGLTLEDLISILDLYKDNVEETGQAIAKSFSKEEMISQLNNMSEGFEELDKIYASIKDSDPFDFKLLDNDNFKETFGGLGDAYTDFIEQVTTTPNDINACQSAFDNLLTAWINSTKILDGVTEENSKLTASMLKQMGVANAEELVADALAHKHANLAAQKYLDAGASDRLANATSNEIEQIFAEAEAAGVTRESLARMYLAKLDVANLQLNTQGEIDQIIALANAAGTSAQYVNQLRTALANLNNAPSPDELMSKPGGATKYRYQQEQSVENLLGKIKNQALNASSFYAKSSGGGATYGGGSSSNKDSGGCSGSETEETFDHIQTKIERLEREIENLGQTADASYKLWSERNTALAGEMSKVTDEIKVQQQAYDYYMKKADSVGLSSTYKDLVKNGAIKIETLKDENLIDKINSYKEWYEKALDAKDAIQDLNDELANLARQKFDNISAEFDNLMSGIEHELNMLDAYVSQTEARGRFVSTKYYSSMIALEKQNIGLLENEYSKLTASLNEAVNSGQIQKYSEEWYNMTGEINSVSEELVEANTNIIEFQNSIRELEWEVFDKLQEFISQIQGESEFLQELMSDEKMFSDEGSITEHGRATLGLHAVNYETYMRQASDYAEELKKINDEIANDPNNLTLLERRQELLESQRDMILAAEDEKQAMKDLISEGYDTFLNYMQELIDKRKEAMQSIKDMYDYEKNVSEQTDEIARLQKIIDSYGGNNSEEAKAKLQEYTVQLQDAKEALEETEYERYLSDQEEMLDTIVSETEEWINARLDNLDGLVQGVIDSTNENAESIKETLVSETEKVGMILTDEMNTIWSTEGSAGKIVAMYGNDFNTHFTNINNTLSAIRDHIYSMVKESDKEAVDNSTNVQHSTSEMPSTPNDSDSTSGQNSSTTTTKPTTPSSTTDSADSNSEWGHWFIKKKNYVSKSKLRKDTSIVDRLKYLDFEASFDARSKYFKAMGGSGTYVGSSAQNSWMIKEMKSHGFAKGGTIGNLINRAGEDGIILARTGEEVLSLEKIDALRNTFKEITPIMNLMNNIPKIPKFEGIGNRVINNNIEMSVILENVNNYEDIFEKFKHDTTGQKFIQQLTLGNALGKNSLAKFKYC